MSYLVIKVIRGKKYLYRQSSYRVGKKVFTKCRCLGRADKIVLNSEGSDVQSTDETPSEIKPRISDRGKEGALGISASQLNSQLQAFKSADISPRNTTALSIRIPLQNHAVSSRSLQKEVKLALNSLDRLGIPAEQFPDITVKHGYFPRFKRRWKTGKYVCTIPWKSKGTRTKFKRAYSNAVSNATLDALGRHDPEKYAQIACAFDQEYRASTKAISTFLKHTSPKGFYSVVALHCFGVVNKSKECLPHAEKLGMLDFNKRRGWRDEATKMMSQVRRKGYKEVQQTYDKELTKARREVTRTRNDVRKYFILSPRRTRARKKFKAALAREQAQLAMQRKLQLVSDIFGMS